MAYSVSQIRKVSGNQVYMKKLTIIEVNGGRQSIDPFGQEKIFKDYAIQLEGNNQFQTGKTYYLRFRVARIPHNYYSSQNQANAYNSAYEQADALNLTVLLTNNKEEQQDEVNQTIGTYSVPVALHSIHTGQILDPVYSTFSCIFTPTTNFSYLVFKIQRNTYDAIENPKQANEDESSPTRGLSGRTWLIDSDSTAPTQGENSYVDVQVNEAPTGAEKQMVTLRIPKHRIFVDYDNGDSFETILSKGQVCQLVNLVNPNGLSGVQKPKWLKLGYQSRPGNLIVINQEPIRVGRSGIFELNNGMEIESFMIASPGGAANNGASIDAFLLDYAYQIT